MLLINRFFATYGFDGIKGFLLSLFPSFKYGTQELTLSLSVALAVISEALGISPIIILVMFMAVIIETMTGIRASKKQGGHFESFKFSRCIIKVFVWVFLFFIFHSFAKDMQTKSDNWIYLCGVWVFDILNVTTMIYFVIEYVTSILENLAVLDGKPKETLVVAISQIFDSMVSRFKTLKK